MLCRRLSIARPYPLVPVSDSLIVPIKVVEIGIDNIFETCAKHNSRNNLFMIEETVDTVVLHATIKPLNLSKQTKELGSKNTDFGGYGKGIKLTGEEAKRKRVVKAY